MVTRDGSGSLILFILLACVMPAASLLAQGPDSKHCTRLEFQQAPWWVLDAQWERSSETAEHQLVMPDLLRDKIIAYSLEGLRRPPGLAVRDLVDHPVALKRNGGVLLTRGRFLRANGTILNLFRKFVVRPPPDKSEALEEGAILVIHQAARAGQDLVVFADVEFPASGSQGQASYLSGFLRLPLVGGDGVRKSVSFLDDRSWGLEDSVRHYYMLGQPFIATLDSDPTAFVVIMAEDEAPQVFFNEPRATGMKLIPLDLGSVGLPVAPSLPFGKPFFEVFPLVMEEVELSPMLAGLFGWEGDLFALSRSPEAGATAWWLTRITVALDTGEISVKGPYRLPTSANHLVVAPGDPLWALIEKGPYISYRQQYIPSAVLFASESFRQLQSAEICPREGPQLRSSPVASVQ